MNNKWIFTTGLSGAVLAVVGFIQYTEFPARQSIETGTLQAASASVRPDNREPPSAYLLLQRTFNSTFGPDTFLNATLAADELRLESIEEGSAAGAVQGRWEFAGPVEIGGRILDIELDPDLTDTLYIAAATGGVWKSTDAGDTFISIWPDTNAQSIGDLAMTSDGRLYAGTGEAAPGALTFGNGGIYVSEDRGASWRLLGLERTERIGRVAIDHVDEQRIFVAALGQLFTPGSDRGVYRSADGGETWELVLAGENDTTGASDVQIDPSNPNRIYAVMWDVDFSLLASPGRDGGVGSGIYRSDDGGETWMRLSGGLPPSDPSVGRIGLGIAPSNPDRLYAIYSDDDGFFSGFFTSIDGGDTWTQLPNDPLLSSSQSSFAWWFARIWVDPLAESRVLVAGVQLMESNSAGLSWFQHVGIHADQHAMVWEPRIPGRVYLGNDGGVYRSDANAASGSWIFGSVQPYTQFFTVDVSEQDPARIVAGAQDNGCNRSWSASDPDMWNIFGCGDGLEVLINPENQDIIYGCSQRGACRRSTNGGESTSSIGATVSDRRNWKTPLMFDPNDPNIMYYAGNLVNRSVDGGQNWSVISPELTGALLPGENPRFRTATAVAPATSDPDVIYVGTDDARLWVTQDLGMTWFESVDPVLPKRWITSISVDPDNADIAYVTYSGFRNGEDTPYVFKTVDGGLSWTDITGNLPRAPVNMIALSGDRLIVVSDVGVFYSDDGGERWRFLGQGLPNVPVTELRVHEPTATVFVSTFGRGVWKLALGAAEDVTDRIELRVTNPRFADGVAHFDLGLNNISAEPIPAPLRSQIVGLSSNSGNITAANADNDEPGAGAFWRYDGSLNGDAELSAGETSQARGLAFNNADGESFSVTYRVFTGPVPDAGGEPESGEGSAANTLIRVTVDPLQNLIDIETINPPSGLW